MLAAAESKVQQGVSELFNVLGHMAAIPALPPPVVPPTVPPPVPPPPVAPWTVGVDSSKWGLVHATDFDVPAPLGSWRTYDQAPVPGYPFIRAYSDGWEDTNGKPVARGGRGGNSRYHPSTVMEVRNGQLIKNLYNDGQGERSAAFVVGGNQLSGRYAINFVADPLPGFKTAYLLWPERDDLWPRMGELDFPEGSLNGVIAGFMHRQDATSGSDQDFVRTSARYTEPHTAVIEWEAGKRVAYYLDGTIVGEWTNRIPKGPMHWVVQTEANIGGERAPVGTRGQLKINWLAMWKRL